MPSPAWTRRLPSDRETRPAEGSGGNAPDYGIALNGIAWQLLNRGDRVGALDYRRRALAVTQATLPAEHSQTITAISKRRFGHPDRLALIDVERARALAASGRRAEAEALARSARLVFRKFPGNVRARRAIESLLAAGSRR